MGGAVSVTNIVDSTIHDSCSKLVVNSSDFGFGFEESGGYGSSENIHSPLAVNQLLRAKKNAHKNEHKYAVTDDDLHSSVDDIDDLTMNAAEGKSANMDGNRDRFRDRSHFLMHKDSENYGSIEDSSSERDVADVRDAMTSFSGSSRSSASNISGLAKNFHSKLSIRSSYLDLSSNDSSSNTFSSSSESLANPIHNKSIYNSTSFYDSRNRRNNYRHIDGSGYNLTNLNGSVIKEIHSEDSIRDGSFPYDSEAVHSKPSLQQTTHHNITDEIDWIQVVDEDEDTDTHTSHNLRINTTETKGSECESKGESNASPPIAIVPLPTGGSGGRPKLTIQLDSSLRMGNAASDDSKSNNSNAVQTRSPLSRLSQDTKQARNQSYMFTQSGTIFVDGLQGGIKKYGLSSEGSNGSVVSTSSGASPANLLTMKERLVVLAKLGQGASSVVFKAFDLVSQRLVAIKMISIFDKGKRRQMVRELVSLFDVIHSSIKLYGNNNSNSDNKSNSNSNISSNSESSKFVVDFYDVFSNIDDGRVVLMMEYIDGGSLQDVIEDLRIRMKSYQKEGSGIINGVDGVDDGGSCLLTEGVISNIAHQCLKCISFLHSLNCLHRDVKPSNFLISRNGTIKIADMGILKRLDGDSIKSISAAIGDVSESVAEEGSSLDGEKEKSLPKTKTFVGTTVYMSPERLEGKEYSFDADIWSLGLSLLSIVLGKPPFEGVQSYWSVLQSIREGVLPAKWPKDEVPSSASASRDYYSNFFLYSDSCRDFINLCLRESPGDRPNPTALLQHDFIKSYNDGAAPHSKSFNASNSNSNIGDRAKSVIPSSPYPGLVGDFEEEKDSLLLQQSIEEHNLIMVSTRKHLALMKASARQEVAEAGLASMSNGSFGSMPAPLAASLVPNPTPIPTSSSQHTATTAISKPKLGLKVLIEPPITAAVGDRSDSKSILCSESSSLPPLTTTTTQPPPAFDKVLLGDVLASSIKTMMCRIFFGQDSLPNANSSRSPRQADVLDCTHSSRLRLIASQLYVSDISILEKQTISYISSIPDFE